MVPVQRVAGEQPLVVDVEHHVTRRVARSRHRHDTRRDGDRLGATEDGRGVRRGVGVGLVDPHVGSEPVGPAVGVGDIVAVGQQHVAEAPEVVDVLRQLPSEPRRVGHQVPVGANQEVRVRPERRPGVVAQRVHARRQLERECRLRRAAGPDGSDRLCGTGDRRPPQLRLLVGMLGLACHE